MKWKFESITDVVDPNKDSLEEDDEIWDKAENVLTNPPPQGADPSVPLLKTPAEKNMPPLNTSLQGGDYSGAPTFLDPNIADTDDIIHGDYGDKEHDTDIMDPQSNLMHRPIAPVIIPKQSSAAPQFTDFNEYLRVTLSVIRDDTINIELTLSPQILTKMNEILYILGDMDSKIKGQKGQINNMEKTVSEERVEILKLNDMIKTKGIISNVPEPKPSIQLADKTQLAAPT